MDFVGTNPHPALLPFGGRSDHIASTVFDSYSTQSTISGDAAFSGEKIGDCIRIAALLRERVLRLAFDYEILRDAKFTLR